MYGNNKYDCILSIYMHFFTIVHLEYNFKMLWKKDTNERRLLYSILHKEWKHISYQHIIKPVNCKT